MKTTLQSVGWAGVATLVLASAGGLLVLGGEDARARSEDDTGRCGPVQLDAASPPRWVEVGSVGSNIEVLVEGASDPIAGTVVREGGRARFHPAFPLTAGLGYLVRGEGCTARFRVPDDAPSAPTVQAVFPRSETIPENILRFYIYFSQPMADGDFLDHLQLEDADTGETLTGVFFDNAHELWSRDRRRITVLVDPGRVKTGLEAHRRWGRAFTPGHTYRLRVRPTWRSVRGTRLREEHVATYRAVSEDRARVDPDAWELEIPRASHFEPLTVHFMEPVDHVSVHHALHVVDADDARVAGSWSLEPGERVAHFRPRGPWGPRSSGYALRVHGRFEDIAGNNVGGAFEHRSGELPPEGEDHVLHRAFAPREDGESNE